MPFRTDIAIKLTADGVPYTMFLVDRPTIEDVMVVEMKLKAAEIMNEESNPDYRVDRGVRDFLIRMGVER